MEGNMTLLAISAFFIYFIIKIAIVKRTETIKRAFAGVYDGKEVTIVLPKDRNKTIYTEGEDVVDLFEHDKFLISGHSLEKVGLPDGAFVYTKPLDNEDIYSLCGRFVVFAYDNERLSKEHPEITNLVDDGYKARQVVTVLENNLAKERFMERMNKILSADDEIKDKGTCIECLWKKYEFASNYYHNEKELVVSITYKQGERKDYSFHSLKFLHGVVKYKSIS